MQDFKSANSEILAQSIIAYVDDFKDEQNSLDTLLQSRCKQLIKLNNTKESQDKLKQEQKKIHLLIVALESTTSDAFEILSFLRNKMQDWSMPVLVITQANQSDVLTSIIKFKLSNLLLKHFNQGTAINIIDEILSIEKKNKTIENQRDKLQQFKTVLDKFNLICETDVKGVITYVNDRFCDVTGYTQDELIGKTHKIIRHSDTSDEIYKKMWAKLNEGKTWEGKLKNKDKQGEPYYVKIIILPIKNENNEVYKYLSSSFLISDIEQEKHKLKKFIVTQKLDQINSKKTTQEEINNKARDLVLKAKQDAIEKEEKFIRYIKELDEELKRLRIKNDRDKKQIAFLEKEYKEYIENTDKEKKIFQERLEKVLIAGRQSYEKSIFLKKKSDALDTKLKKSQEGIKTLQNYIDEYRNKIKELKDIIAMHEKTIEELNNKACT
jgi:PAS domain S-box-containing protein